MKKLVLLLLLTLGAFGLYKVLGPAPEVENKEQLKVYKHSDTGSSTSVDPAMAASVYDSNLIVNLYDTLLEYKYLKRPYELKPNLASSMPKVSEDGLTYTFRIKKGVTFMNDDCFPEGKGREVTVHDLIYQLKRVFDPKQPSRNQWLWRGRIVGLDEWKKAGADYGQEVAGLKALDKYTLQIQLIKPYPQLLYTLAMAPAAFVPREAVEKYGKEFAVHPVGSGPFILKSFNTKKVVLEKNLQYRQVIFDVMAEGYDEAVHGGSGIRELNGKRLPLVDRLEISAFSDGMPRWSSFLKGNEIQFTNIPNPLVDEILESKHPIKLKAEYAEKYQQVIFPEYGYVYSNFNMDDPRLGYHKNTAQNAKNKVLRCAIRKGFNWKERVERFYFGVGEAFPGIIIPGIDGHDPSLSKESITHDFAQSKQMLIDAGWLKSDGSDNGLPVLEWGGVSSVTSTQFFEQFRGWMTKIGYPQSKVRSLTYSSFGDFMKATRQRKVMLHGLAWNIDYPDSENVLALYYGPNHSPGSNSSNYQNPEYDKLYEEAAIMQPSPERSEIYKRMNRMLIDDCVFIGSFSRTGIGLFPKNVIMQYDRGAIGGSFYKYVDVQ